MRAVAQPPRLCGEPTYAQPGAVSATDSNPTCLNARQFVGIHVMRWEAAVCNAVAR